MDQCEERVRDLDGTVWGWGVWTTMDDSGSLYTTEKAHLLDDDNLRTACGRTTPSVADYNAEDYVNCKRCKRCEAAARRIEKEISDD